MRVLVMGGRGHLGETTMRGLRERGHEVLRCHDAGSPPFPCAALVGECPFDGDAPVDAALVVRDDVWPRPTQHDRGVTCAVRARVPVLMMGKAALNPYEDWINGHVLAGQDPVDAVERVVAQRREA